MEPGYTKANNHNLPKVDIFMVGNYFATNPDFCGAEFKNVVTSGSMTQSYGDEAIVYVQLRRDSDMCTIKCMVCPEHEVSTKSYRATMIVDEKEGKVVSVQCHDCAASTRGCKHALAFLMWAHRRSEEPASTETLRYWKNPKLALANENIKYITLKEMTSSGSSAGVMPCSTQIVSQTDIITEFVQIAKSKNITNCAFLKYICPSVEEYEKLSLHYLILEHGDDDCDSFLYVISKYFTEKNIEMAEKMSRSQYENNLWQELRYGRVTDSIAYEVSKCHTADESLIALIMGAVTMNEKIKRKHRELKSKVKDAVGKRLGKKINECGLFISTQCLFVASSPDGIVDNEICIDIKCPDTENSYKKYLLDDDIPEEFMALVQIEMLVTNLKKCYFCVADWNFEITNHVEMVLVDYDEFLAQHYISKISQFWKKYIYPVLYETTK